MEVVQGNRVDGFEDLSVRSAESSRSTTDGVIDREQTEFGALRGVVAVRVGGFVDRLER